MRMLPGIAWIALGCASAPVIGQTLKPNEVYSSISATPLSRPNPVTGSDGRTHLAYELLISNPSKLFITIDKVEALDPQGAVHATMQGDALSSMITNYDGNAGTVAPGGTAIVFLDVAFANPGLVPKAIDIRLAASRQLAGADSKPAPYPSTEPIPAQFVFTGARTDVGGPARIIDAPLRGERWIAVNGCCDSITSHRGAVMTVNGKMRVPERFAIDWIQLRPDNRVFAGSAQNVASYPYYGASVFSVADGVVVNRYDEAEAQVPNGTIKGITPANIAGNMLVVDIGGGAYALYAHMQRGSLKAKLGDKVRRGQILGLLGNTGNSSAPHLHFHLMDGPSPLNANGLPYVFRRYVTRGVLGKGQDDAIETGEVAKIDPVRKGAHTNELPLNDEVVDF